MWKKSVAGDSVDLFSNKPMKTLLTGEKQSFPTTLFDLLRHLFLHSGFQNALSEFHQFRKYDQIVWILTFDADNSNFVDFQSNSGIHVHFKILITISVKWYYECSFVVCRENTENQFYIEAGKVLLQRGKKTFDKKWKDFINYLLIWRDLMWP